MRRTPTLVAIAIAAIALPFAAIAQAPAKAEGGTEGSGMKPSTEQPKFVKKTTDQKAAAKSERKAVRAKSEGGAPMTDGSTVKPSQEQPARAKKASAKPDDVR